MPPVLIVVEMNPKKRPLLKKTEVRMIYPKKMVLTDLLIVLALLPFMVNFVNFITNAPMDAHATEFVYLNKIRDIVNAKLDFGVKIVPFLLVPKTAMDEVFAAKGLIQNMSAAINLNPLQHLSILTNW
jgi:hypothetical protein